MELSDRAYGWRSATRIMRSKSISKEVQQRGDLMSGMGEISENPPSEANFDKTMSIVEAQEFIQVTANPGALSRLDNAADQPEADSTPEQKTSQASESESRNPEAQTSDSSDRACRASLPAMVSEREERRIRLEKERRAVERMVEGKLTAGSFSLGEIEVRSMGQR